MRLFRDWKYRTGHRIGLRYLGIVNFVITSGFPLSVYKMASNMLQTVSQFLAFIGTVMAALGIFGSYYFGKETEDTRQRETQENFGKILTQNQELNDQLTPFLQLAQAARPDLDQNAAPASLRKEIEQLRQVASKHEFTPLESGLRNVFVQRLQGLSLSFSEAGVTVRITHETWSPTTTKQYAAQLASLLREAGLEAQGPDQITYFLVTPSSPIEWGYNDRDIEHVEKLYQAILTIVRPSEKWTKASHQEPGTIRIHFGGDVLFEKGGIVTVG